MSAARTATQDVSQISGINVNIEVHKEVEFSACYVGKGEYFIEGFSTSFPNYDIQSLGKLNTRLKVHILVCIRHTDSAGKVFFTFIDQELVSLIEWVMN